jgi:hypothetical protein
MGRGINKLSAKTVSTARAPGGLRRLGDGGGLYLLIRERGDSVERRWLFRWKRGTRDASTALEMSLAVPLSAAVCPDGPGGPGLLHPSLQAADSD